MLTQIIDWLVYSVLKLNPQSRLTESFHFFLYDTVKILLLLGVMISIIGFFRTFIPASAVKRWIIQRRGLGFLFASLFGAVTPFCSCSSIPIFLSFLRAGIPLGITFSFLITSPIINEYLLVLMLGFFGWKITIMYFLSGVAIGVISGMILGRLKLENSLVPDMVKEGAADQEITYGKISDRITYGFREAESIVKKLWLWIIIAVAVGALVHNYVPKEAIQRIIARTGIFSVPLAALLGVPMYGSCAAIVPIAVVLFKKGLPLGTALAFMMATSALSFPEAILLRRAMRLRLIAIFFLVVAAAIILTGYLFNILQKIII